MSATRDPFVPSAAAKRPQSKDAPFDCPLIPSAPSRSEGAVEGRSG